VMPGEANVPVRAVGAEGEGLTRTGEELIRNTHRRPYSRFEGPNEARSGDGRSRQAGADRSAQPISRAIPGT
jgi:hypothetical protein